MIAGVRFPLIFQSARLAVTIRAFVRAIGVNELHRKRTNDRAGGRHTGWVNKGYQLDAGLAVLEDVGEKC